MRRFVLVIDRDGISISWTRGRRLAFWVAPGLRRDVGPFEVFTPRPDWIKSRGER